MLLIEKTCFPTKKGNFCLFSVFLFLSPSTFFDLPLFLFLFLCLSLALVFLSSFLSFFFAFFFAFFLFLVFVSFHFSFFFAFVFGKGQHEHFKLQFFFINLFSFLWFLVLFYFQIPFPYLCLFLILSYVLFNMNVFGFKKHNCLVKRGVAAKRAFLSTCVLQNVKSYRFFWRLFCPILVDVQKAL